MGFSVSSAGVEKEDNDGEGEEPAGEPWASALASMSIVNAELPFGAGEEDRNGYEEDWRLALDATAANCFTDTGLDVAQWTSESCRRCCLESDAAVTLDLVEERTMGVWGEEEEVFLGGMESVCDDTRGVYIAPFFIL